MSTQDKCPRCESPRAVNVFNELQSYFQCGSQRLPISGVFQQTQICMLNERTNLLRKAQTTLHEIKQICKKHAGHRQMQIAGPHRQILNLIEELKL